jgi:dTMP kinase
MQKGRFIVFEGIDGSGKSTQLRLLGARLRENNLKVYETAEPTDNPIGSMVRRILRGELTCAEPAIAALFAADRIDHLLNRSNGLIEMIRAGTHVICDRYYLSSYAYHSVHAPMDWVIATNSLSAEMLKPDLNIFIDVPVELCLQRMNAVRDNLELYEAEANLKAVREKYFEAFERLRQREIIQIIDGSAPVEVVAELVWQATCHLFEPSLG